MAISEFEIKRCEKLAAQFVKKHRPPAHLRHRVDLAFRIKGQSVELFEIRALMDDTLPKIEKPVAKTTYVKGSKHWKVFWWRADLKWHAYDPEPIVMSFEDFLAQVDADAHACFFG